MAFGVSVVGGRQWMEFDNSSSATGEFHPDDGLGAIVIDATWDAGTYSLTGASNVTIHNAILTEIGTTAVYRIEYTTDDGTTWTTLFDFGDTGTPAAGTSLFDFHDNGVYVPGPFRVSIPAAVGTEAKVAISYRRNS